MATTVVKRKPRPVELVPEQGGQVARPESASVRLVGVCELYQCASARDVEQGQKLLSAIKEVKAEVEAHHRPTIQKAHETHKEAIAALNRFLKPLEEAANRVTFQVNRFIREERARAEEAARKERERLAAIAREEARAEAEKRAAEEKARLEAEAANRPASPFIDPEPVPEVEVEKFIPEIVYVPEVEVQKPDFKAMGARTRKTWVWEIESIKELCRGVAEGSVPAEYILPNTTLINTLVRQQKSGFACRGIRAFEKEEVI